jgi:hypothetical protein
MSRRPNLEIEISEIEISKRGGPGSGSDQKQAKRPLISLSTSQVA